MVIEYRIGTAGEKEVGSEIAKVVTELAKDSKSNQLTVVGIKPIMGEKSQPGTWQPPVFGHWSQSIPAIWTATNPAPLLEWLEKWDQQWSSRPRPMLPLLTQEFVVFVVDEKLFDELYENRRVAAVDNRLYWIVQNAIWVQEQEKEQVQKV